MSTSGFGITTPTSGIDPSIAPTTTGQPAVIYGFNLSDLEYSGFLIYLIVSGKLDMDEHQMRNMDDR